MADFSSGQAKMLRSTLPALQGIDGAAQAPSALRVKRIDQDQSEHVLVNRCPAFIQPPRGAVLYSCPISSRDNPA